jgi:ceramide glucosyltransferase
MLTVVTSGAEWAVGLLAAAAVLRLVMQIAIARGTLADSSAFRTLPLVPLQDIASFLIWVAAFFGKTIVWRGRTFRLLRDGRLQLLEGEQKL